MTREPVQVDSCVYLGVDPGLSGVLAVLIDDRVGNRPLISTIETPTVVLQTKSRKKGKGDIGKRFYNLHAFKDLLRPFTGMRVIAGIEALSGYPGLSSQSVFGMGYGMAAWEMALVMMDIPITRVPSQRWKKAMGVQMGAKDDKIRKAASVLRAKQLFPWLSFPLVKDHNRADAVLIAEYMRRTHRL